MKAQIKQIAAKVAKTAVIIIPFVTEIHVVMHINIYFNIYFH